MNTVTLVTISTILYLVKTNSWHCYTKKDGQLLQNTGVVTWEIPINIRTLVKAVETLSEDIGESDDDKVMMTYTHENTSLDIPNQPSESITLARSKCLARHQKSATLSDILSSRIYEKYRTLSSISYFMEKESGLTCSISQLESGDKCWNKISEVANENKLKIDIEGMKKHLEKHKMGILQIKNKEVKLTSDPNKHILPCVSDAKNKPQGKWEVLRANYLRPQYKQILKKLENLRRQLDSMEKVKVNSKRNKRSLFSSIFGLAGASETKEIRKALRTELGNQQEMATNMEAMLRSQLKMAERVENEHNILFKIKEEEEHLETSLKEITIFLENALANTSDATSKNHQDTAILMRFTTLSQRCNNLEKMIDTVTDIIHCPFSRCVPILDDFLSRNNIGTPITYLMIAETLKTEFKNGKVKVILKNITIESSNMLSIKCIPFLQGTEPVKLDYKGKFAEKGGLFFQIDQECHYSHGQTFCEHIAWKRDNCLASILLNQTVNKGECNKNIIQDTRTEQDFSYTDGKLEIYSKTQGEISINSGAVEFKSKLKTGTNFFKLGGRKYTIRTNFLQFSCGNNMEVKIEGEVTIPSQEKIEVKDIARIDIGQLVEYEEKLPHLSVNMTSEAIKVNRTIPHPAIIFLSEPSQSWYVYVVISSILLLLASTILYCKFRHCCTKNKGKKRVETKTDFEEQINLIPIPHSNMTLVKHGCVNEIQAAIDGTPYYWTGSRWRNGEGDIADGISEPPYYLRTQLSTHQGGVEVSFKNKKPYINLKGFKNTFWDKQKQMYCIEESTGKSRILPEYTSPKPDENTLKLLSQAEAEYKVNKK